MNKKIIFALLVISLLILSGCGEKDSYEKPTTTTSSPNVKSTDLETEKPTDYSSPDITGPALTDKLKDLIAKGKQNDNLKYKYKMYEKDGIGYYATVYLKRNKMTQIFDTGNAVYSEGTKYTSAYIDLTAKTVKGYCEERLCEGKNVIIPVDINDLNLETPLDVLNRLKYGEDKGTVMINNRESQVIGYEQGENQVLVYLWTYKGVPVKYEILDGKTLLKKVEFSELVVGDVEDKDLVHQTIE